ncbi:acyl-CoA reductase (LuxC) [mine drainage metagenome]|uniref:Acyl-CoA reductase (LuxC) n=1 Tax=mine drainage metagenome TaxID=410659 RepID=A0A1J5T2E8_9ZZZZ
MELQERINLFVRLGQYMQSSDAEWQAIKERASRENPWFVTEFIELAISNICAEFLQKEKLESWAESYNLKAFQADGSLVGIVMAGNIPLVGFHDFLCVFLSGKRMMIKASSKDEILIKHIVKKLLEWEEPVEDRIHFAQNLKGCDAYIATGSNNSSRYFDYYFGKYPNIIRRNRTSVAILDGTETTEELNALADDIQLYFGLGCRNVTKLYVPKNYDFIKLLNALKKYEHFLDFHKYKHNYDYHLTIAMMNNKFYMNNGSVVLSENESLFSPVSQVHYGFYDDAKNIISSLQNNIDVQCIVGHGFTAFGKAQQPSLKDYADGVDTMQFLLSK